jgi:hypothetical protein
MMTYLPRAAQLMSIDFAGLTGVTSAGTFVHIELNV